MKAERATCPVQMGEEWDEAMHLFSSFRQSKAADMTPAVRFPPFFSYVGSQPLTFFSQTFI